MIFASESIDPASAGAVPSAPEIASQGYKLSFSDEFNGDKLDEEKWSYRTDSKGQSTELTANVVVSNGAVQFLTKKERSRGKEYTGGGIISKIEFTHGYYEARFNLPAGSGWHTSFFTMHYNGKDTVPVLGREEIDICEADSTSGPKCWGDAYTVHDWGSKLLPHGVELPSHKLPEGHAKPHIEKGDLREFHTWGMEFTPTVINFYLEGQLRGSVDATLFTHTPMNVWLTTLGWAGVVDESKLPSSAQCDYFRFFTKD